MSTNEIRVPDIGDFKDIPIIEVHVQPGSQIAVDDPLITLESDKATMEVPASQAGTSIVALSDSSVISGSSTLI